MNCAGCRKALEVGDHYIEDTVSGFLRQDGDPDLDDIMADFLGGRGGRIVYCEDCTQDGGDYLFETVYGDEDDA